MRRYIPPFGLIAMVFGCSTAASAPLTETERTAIADSLTVLVDSVFNEARQLDADGVLSFVTSEPGFSYGGEGEMLFGRSAFETSMRGAYARLRSQSVELTSNETVVFGRDLAVTSTAGPSFETDTLGVATAPRSLTITLVWHRGAEGWKLVAGHQSLPDAVSVPAAP